MFKLLSTAACALVLAAPGLAAAQGARPADENAIEKPDPRAQARPDRQDRRQLRPDSPEERRAQRRAERQAEERQPSPSAQSKRPEGSATAPKKGATAQAKPDATPPKDSPTARTPTAPDKPKSSAAAPSDRRDSKPPQTSADTSGAKPAPGTASAPPSPQPRAAQRSAPDSATAEGSASGSAAATPPAASPTARSTKAPTASPSGSAAGTAGGGVGSTAQSSDPGTAGSTTAAPGSSTGPAARSLAAPSAAPTASPDQQQQSATPEVGTATGSTGAPLTTQQAPAAAAPSAQQPTALQQQAAPEAQAGAAQAEPQAAATAAEAGASTGSDEDGVSATEFWTGAGLAMAPWVLQRILQGQGGNSVALVPQQSRYPYAQYPYTQQPYGYPYAYDPQTGRYLDQRTGQIVEETTIIQRGDARRVGGGQQARGGGSGQAGGQAGSFAQAPQTNIPAPAQVVALSDWRYDDIYRSGWGADQLLGAEVNGRDGKPLGVVENILIGRDNQIASVLIKDQTQKTVANVPWDQVRMAGDGRALTVPLAGGADLKQYSLFSGDNNLLVSSVAWMGPNAQQQSRTWKVTDLLNDYVTLASGNGYGYVDDVVFDGQGHLSAVVVYRDPSLGGGVAAYPFSAYGFEPWAPYYALPYDQNEVARVPEFQEERID